MIKSLALVLVAVLAISCKKKDEPAAAAKTEPTPAPAPAPTPAPEPTPAPTPAATGFAAIAIPQAKSTIEQVLTGGQPTEEHLKAAKEQGLKVVVNLRGAAEEKEFAGEVKQLSELGVKYVHIPVDGKTGDGLNEENAKKLAELLGGEKPMIVHCASGQRVGALLALKAFYVDKAAPDKALELGRANGLSKPELEKIVQDLMAKKG